MKTKKRILASLAALALCLTLLPVVQRANAAFVDLQFTPYLYPETPPEPVSTFEYSGYYCEIGTDTNIYNYQKEFIDRFVITFIGEETLPDGVEPSSISITKIQWSPGETFDASDARTVVPNNPSGKVSWIDQNTRLAKLNYCEYWNNVIEAAGLKNTDPFTVRITQGWNGGEYACDVTYNGLRRNLDLFQRGIYLEGLDRPSGAVGTHINNSFLVPRSPSVTKNSNGTYSLKLTYLRKKDAGGVVGNVAVETDENGEWRNSLEHFCVNVPNLFDGEHVYPARGVISPFDLSVVSSQYLGNDSGERDDSFQNDDYDRYTKTLTFQTGESISLVACRCTSYAARQEESYGTYYHSPVYTLNYTFGGSSGDEEPETHTLTVNYALAGGLSWPGGSAPEPYTEQIMEGVTYNIPSPEFAGLAPDVAVVTGTMGKEDQTVTVTYGTAHTLTVNYQLAPGVVLPVGRSLPSACVMQVLEGGTYTVKTPRLGDLVPDKEIVIGEMGTEDKSETVTYYGRLSVTGEENGDELTYTVRYCPANALLLAARYDANGRMTYARTVAVPSGDSQDTLIMGGAGGKYKLLLVDRTTFAPLCRAWESE